MAAIDYGVEWKKLKKSLPVYKEAPSDYLSVGDFARRAEASPPAIKKAIVAGKIPKQHCMIVDLGPRQKTVFINWNRCGYNYLASKNPKWWPKDFEINDACEYKPIDTPDISDKGVMDAPSELFGEDEIQYQKVTDINSAKYRVEQLKIAKLQAEQKLANNELVLIKDVIALNREMGTELKAALKRSENKMAPELLHCKTVLEIRALLAAYHREVIEVLNPIMPEDEYAEDQETN